MNLISFNPEESNLLLTDSDVLSNFKKEQESEKEIQQGMSPKKLPEIVSDHHINVMRTDLEVKGARPLLNHLSVVAI